MARTLGQLAATDPGARVRLLFQNEHGTGMLETTAGHAADPNASGRYFPPAGETAASLGWAQPYWYPDEVTRVIVLEEVRRYA